MSLREGLIIPSFNFGHFVSSLVNLPALRGDGKLHAFQKVMGQEQKLIVVLKFGV